MGGIVLLGIDYQGVGIIITAVFAGIASIIAAWNARSTSQIKGSISTNGDPREIGQIASDVAKAVAPPQRRATDTPDTPAPTPEGPASGTP